MCYEIVPSVTFHCYLILEVLQIGIRPAGYRVQSIMANPAFLDHLPASPDHAPEDQDMDMDIKAEAKIEAEAKESDGGYDRDWYRGGAEGSERERERANVAEVEMISLRASVRSLETIETRLRNTVKDKREARAKIECHLGLV
ncbi:hypothetical protein Tco_1164533 [Tanacetum coccineum]